MSERRIWSGFCYPTGLARERVMVSSELLGRVLAGQISGMGSGRYGGATTA
jgi:hypothetical protein